MNTLSVWRFPTPDGAEEALAELIRLVVAERASVDDAALIAWPAGRRAPQTRALGSITGNGRLWGGFWGMVLSLIFLTPRAGPVFGAAAGAVAGSLEDFGVIDDFIKRVRVRVTPGTSAIFAITSSSSAREIDAGFAGPGVETLRSELSPTQAQNLHEALADR